MSAILLGIVVLALLFLAAKAFVGADPRKLIPAAKIGGGVGALGVAALFGFRGQFHIALPFGLAGLGLLGWWPFGRPDYFQRTEKSPGQMSRVRSAAIEMELDHDTGAMGGRMLTGPHEGVMPDALDIK